MIYTCIADGIRSPPAFFLENKYKEPMKMQNENTKRAWLYARMPHNLGFCALSAHGVSSCKIRLPAAPGSSHTGLRKPV